MLNGHVLKPIDFEAERANQFSRLQFISGLYRVAVISVKKCLLAWHRIDVGDFLLQEGGDAEPKVQVDNVCDNTTRKTDILQIGHMQSIWVHHFVIGRSGLYQQVVLAQSLNGRHRWALEFL